MDYRLKPMLAVQSESAKGNQVATLEALMADLAQYGEDRYAGEPKFDGFRLIVRRTADGVEVYIGRNGSNYTDRLPLLEEVLLALPPDTVVDGELLHKTGRGDVQSAVFTQRRYTRDDLRFVVFDVLFAEGEDLRQKPWDERRRRLEGLLGEVESDRLMLSPLVPVAPTSLKAFVEQGFEGLVVKRRRSRYVNARSSDWIKFKVQMTLEAKVIGFKPGKAGGAYAGMVGAFEIELLDSGARTTIKCGNDANHKEATKEWKGEPFTHQPWKGSVCEIKYFSLGADGVPLSPQFFRRRLDRVVGDNPTLYSPSRPASTRPAIPPDVPSSKGAARPARPPRRPSGPRTRNYAAMKDDKLLRSIEELIKSSGEAYEKCMARGGDPAADLEVAQRAARDRDLKVVRSV